MLFSLVTNFLDQNDELAGPARQSDIDVGETLTQPLKQHMGIVEKSIHNRTISRTDLLSRFAF